jgi:hypothetical protein
MTKPLLTLLSVLVLAGCTVDSYIAPVPVTSSAMPPQPTPVLTRQVNKSFDATWSDLIAHAHQFGFGIKHEDKSKGVMTAWFPAFEPAQYITCGTVEVSQGSFTTYTRLLEYLAERTVTNLNVMMDVSLRRIAADKTEVSVMAHYTFRADFTNNLPTGAMQGGQIVQFDSVGAAPINLQLSTMDTPIDGLCQPTGAAEQSILRAASR